jgi:hypothetical protein
MTRQTRLLKTTLALVSGTQCLQLCAAAKKPNIVFIFTDDQAPDTIGALGTWGNDRTVIKPPTRKNRLIWRMIRS